MKVLIADKFEQFGLNQLRELGNKIEYIPTLSGNELATALKEFSPEILIVRSTKVNHSMLEGSSLKLIIRAGTGYDNIDVESAKKNHIGIANCPGKNSYAVAELTFGLILSIDRHIPDNVEQLRQGIWDKKKFSNAEGLFGRTLGIVGFGRIGKEVTKRADAFGMKVLVYSHWLTPEIAKQHGVRLAQSLEDLSHNSDVVSIHVSYTPDKKGIINKAFFDAMKDRAIFVNTSRAEVVDQDALLEALKSKKIFAGLDVFQGEPSSAEGSYEGPLKNYSNVYCTHHIGASTKQAQLAIADEVVRIVEEFITSGNIRNSVKLKEGQNL